MQNIYIVLAMQHGCKTSIAQSFASVSLIGRDCCSLRDFVVVYHLPKTSENFGWNVNEKINFVSPNGNFLGKTGFLER